MRTSNGDQTSAASNSRRAVVWFGESSSRSSAGVGGSQAARYSEPFEELYLEELYLVIKSCEATPPGSPW